MGSLLGCTLAAALLATGGTGTQRVETTIQDDAALLHRNPGAVRVAALQMKDLGVDRVRITAGWSALAPRHRATHMPPAPFDPTDSATYPHDGFNRIDEAVKAVEYAGMQAQLDLAFWAPRWATRRASHDPDRQRYIPDAAAFARFSTAVATRYSGHFTDPTRGIVTPLPRVELYTTWNEPNKQTFLQPQWKRTGPRSFRPFSPFVYRPMHEQAYAAIKAVDKDNRVLIGGLASRGGKRGVGGVPPMLFLRTLACVDGRYKRLRVPGCRGAAPLHADGLALHPYSLKVTPGTPAKSPQNVYLADLQRVDDLVNRLADDHRIDRRWPLYVTEYGYETRPPDPNARFTPEEQARNLGWATFLANSDPTVKMFGQFLLTDSGVTGSALSTKDGEHANGFQTGLLYDNGEPKPAAKAFKYPLFLSYATGSDGTPGLIVYGGVRPGAGVQTVRLERRGADGTWIGVETVGDQCDDDDNVFQTDPTGFFRRAAPWEGPGDYRLAVYHGLGEVDYGAVIPVTEQPLIAAAPPATG